ncbi:MAG: hypothetical protein NC078_02565 [Ruminococcus sp.]|nr:hypothetical protein [Ruminococcus sp.]
MSNKLIYFGEIHRDNTVYSIDKLAVSFTVSEDVYSEFINENSPLLRLHGYDRSLIVKGGNYPYRFCAKYGQSTLNLILGKPSDTGNFFCLLECNPNKCFTDGGCIEDVKTLLSYSLEYRIWKIDVAVDIPVNYELVTVMKDRRYYSRSGTSTKNMTYYLGKRNKIGRAKVYNKAHECKLKNDLTRVEITLGNPLSNDWQHTLWKALPTIYLVNQDWKFQSNKDDEIKLSSTDKTLISLLRESPRRIEEFKKLDYKKQQKIKPYVFCESEKLLFDINIINSVSLAVYDVIKPKNFCLNENKFVPVSM